MKRILHVVLGIIILLSFLKLFLNKDIPQDITVGLVDHNDAQIEYPSDERNITINGVDYLQSQAPIGNYGGELIISTIGEGPKTFNPCNTKDATSSSMAGLMFDGLLTTNPKNGLVKPLLAKKFTIHGNDYYIKLRDGIKWSDGKPITADDVIYTYEEIVFKGLGNPSAMDAMKVDGVLPKLVKMDDTLIKFTTPKPFAPFLRQLSYPIVPKHYFKKYSDQGESVFNAFLNPNTNPDEIVISGAYKLKEYVAAQRVVFEKNPNYYKVNKKGDKLPYLDKLVYLIVGDTNNEILKFEAGEVDLLNLRGSDVARYKLKEKNSDFQVYNLGPDTGTLFVVINLNNRKNPQGKFYVNPVKASWFANRDFRAAIDWAIDRKNMVQNIASGVAEPLYTAESLNSIYLNKFIKGHPKDEKVVWDSLKKAGFYYKDGVLYDKKNNKVEFDLYTNAGNLEREALGVMLKQDLEDFGMKVNFKPLEFNSLVNKLTNTMDWDMAIIGLTGSPLEPHDGKNVWTSSGSLHMFNQRPQNYRIDDRFAWEKELDDIFREASLKLSYEERKPLYDRYQVIIYDQKPIIYLYSPTRIFAIRKKFGNIFPSSLIGLIYNLDEIFINKECK